MSHMPNYYEIMPYIYIGNKYALNDIYLFNMVINCTQDVEFPREEIRKYYKQEYIYLDQSLTPTILEKIYQYVQQNKKILIHGNIDVTDALALVKQYQHKYHAQFIL